ncbi:MAG TPA: hypothetical protein VNH18_27465, partial [Bryobacteraceae bacterium]|nr:hypothetical protein [Bryobacteraceae bacterium]
VKTEETQEGRRLAEADSRSTHWKRWGPYVSERAWGTVREDYSADGDAWTFLPHDHARSRAYRWNEDGIAGICDRHQKICFAIAMWNGRDPILKERLFGLNGHEGNHGEDVKECYYYLDSTPTHSYMKHLYKYPQAPFPYQHLVDENHVRGKEHPEYELVDTGIFDGCRYFDVFTEYAKASSEDILIRVTVANRGPEAHDFHFLPTVWFRNTWSWGNKSNRPWMRRAPKSPNVIELNESRYGKRWMTFGGAPELLFTENETNHARIHEGGYEPLRKDAINEAVVNGRADAVNPAQLGTKVAGHYRVTIPAGGEVVFRMRLADTINQLPEPEFDAIFAERIAEADEFYATIIPADLSADAQNVMRQSFAGMMWGKQFYHYIVRDWLHGDPAGPTPPASRIAGRNHEWPHIYNADVISMPDKWEYPWYAAWDLAFHCVPIALVDPDFAKEQLILLLREWYMHPNGQLPAYEWAFGDVNPPVHAWAAWRVYKIDKKLRGVGDRTFLQRVFQKLMLNFTWWVNRKDAEGNNVFEGGFLGLDNVGVFDRSSPLPVGGILEQADGTGWMAMYSLNLLAIAMELAKEDPAYEDVASKFWEHFLLIANAINNLGTDHVGMWNEQDGFYYDVMHLPGDGMFPMRIRSIVGLIPLFAVQTLEEEVVDKLPGFKRRMEWFIENRPDLTQNLASMSDKGMNQRRLLSLAGQDQLRRVLEFMLDENEFLSPYGIRALSRAHLDAPYTLRMDGHEYTVHYEPAESTTGLFGGNSNWRGPVWIPMNFLIIESLQKFHHYLGDDFQVEHPTGSGNHMKLCDVAADLSRRLTRIFLKGEDGTRPVHGASELYRDDPHWRDLVLFYEYFHGDNGSGLGASHQTGWTGVVAKLLQQSGE